MGPKTVWGMVARPDRGIINRNAFSANYESQSHREAGKSNVKHAPCNPDLVPPNSRTIVCDSKDLPPCKNNSSSHYINLMKSIRISMVLRAAGQITQICLDSPRPHQPPIGLWLKHLGPGELWRWWKRIAMSSFRKCNPFQKLQDDNGLI